jgi:hypothetical protein
VTDIPVLRYSLARLLDKVWTYHESLGFVEVGLVILVNMTVILLRAGKLLGKQPDENCRLIDVILDRVQLGILTELIVNILKWIFVTGKDVVGMMISIVEPAGKLFVIWMVRV